MPRPKPNKKTKPPRVRRPRSDAHAKRITKATKTSIPDDQVARKTKYKPVAIAAAEALEVADIQSRSKVDAEAGFSADSIMRTMLDYDRVTVNLAKIQTDLRRPATMRKIATELGLACGEAAAMMLSHLEEATLALNEANRFLRKPDEYLETLGLQMTTRVTWDSLRRHALGRAPARATLTTKQRDAILPLDSILESASNVTRKGKRGRRK